MQDCSEGDPSAALSNNGSTSFVNFTILLEKPIACQKVLYFPVQKTQLQSESLLQACYASRTCFTITRQFGSE